MRKDILRMKSLVIICLLLASGTVIGQTAYSIETSKASPTPDGVMEMFFKGADDTYYAVRHVEGEHGLHKMYFERYARDLSKIDEKNIDLNIDGTDIAYAFTLRTKDSLYITGTTFDKKAGKETLYCIPVSIAYLGEKGRTRVLAVDGPKKGCTYTYSVSPNSAHISMLVVQGADKRYPIGATLYSFDGNMQLKGARQVPFSMHDTMFYALDTRIDDDGNAFVLSRFFVDPKKYLSERVYDYELSLLAFYPDKDSAEIHPLTLDYFRVNDLQYAIGENGMINCSGIYSEKKKGSVGYKGLIAFIYDPVKRQMVRRGDKAFTEDEISEFVETHQVTEKKFAEDLRISPLMPLEDGSYIYTIEKYFIETFSRYTPTGDFAGTSHNYTYLSFIVVHLDKDFDMDWIKYVPKEQISTDDEGHAASFMLATVPGQIRILYNDNPKNEKTTKQDNIKPYEGRNGVLTLVTITPEGKMKKELLDQATFVGNNIRPAATFPISDKMTLMYCDQRGEYRLAVLIYK